MFRDVPGCSGMLRVPDFIDGHSVCVCVCVCETVQRVKEASFFEVTTSRSREDVNGFHHVTFGPGGKPVISCSVFR